MVEISSSIGSPTDLDIYERIAAALEGEGWVVIPDGLPSRVCQCLQQLNERERGYQAAGVGRGAGRNRNPELRRDRIAWIEDGDQAKQWNAWTSGLQQYLNRRLFLGLFSFESHFAIYGPGDFYRTHVDAFRGQSNRRVSLVTYLNGDWRAEHGGELVIYHPETGAPLQRVLPTLGTLVLFLSAEFPHEVLPALRERHSVAGWFRVNGSSAGQTDPPA